MQRKCNNNMENFAKHSTQRAKSNSTEPFAQLASRLQPVVWHHCKWRSPCSIELYKPQNRHLHNYLAALSNVQKNTTRRYIIKYMNACLLQLYLHICYYWHIIGINDLITIPGRNYQILYSHPLCRKASSSVRRMHSACTNGLIDNHVHHWCSLVFIFY